MLVPLTRTILVLAAAATPALAAARTGEVVAFRTSDGLALVDPPARIAPAGRQPDAVLLPRATPSRTGPDAGAILCYFGGADPSPAAGSGLLRATSLDQGRTWSAADPVILNGWPKDLQSYRAASTSAVQLQDGRIRLYLQPERTVSTAPPSPPRILSAISNDGLTFAVEDGHRFELTDITDADIIRLPDNKPDDGDTRRIGPWLMFFTRDGSTLLATSADGLTWARDTTVHWTSATRAAAGLTAEGSRTVRLYAHDRSGLVSAVFDPSTGQFKPDAGTRLAGHGGADPSATPCGDGSTLLVCVRETTDKPHRGPADPIPDRRDTRPPIRFPTPPTHYDDPTRPPVPPVPPPSKPD